MEPRTQSTIFFVSFLPESILHQPLPEHPCSILQVGSLQTVHTCIPERIWCRFFALLFCLAVLLRTDLSVRSRRLRVYRLPKSVQSFDI